MRYSWAIRLALFPTISIAFHTTAQAPAARVSASVPTSENPRPAWGPAQTLKLAAEPSLVIGTRSEPVYQFERVAGAVQLRDRSIVVGDGGNNELRFYNRSGIYLSSRGRRGEGPGEFQGLSQLHIRSGDSLLAGSSYSISLFTPSGRFVRRLDPLRPPAPLPIGEKFILAALDGGKSIMGALPRPVESNRSPQNGLRWTDSIHLALIAPDNALLAVLGRFPSRVMEWQGTDLSWPWFSPEAVSASDGKHFFLGFGTDYSIRVFGISGRLERIIRRKWVAERVDVGAWIRARIEATGAADSGSLRKALLGAPRAETLPAFAAMVVDRVGQLWVRDARMLDYVPQEGTKPSRTNWSVFSPAGLWLGDVHMPARFRPTDIGADYVLGVAQDADGVETVALYKLERKG